MISHLAQEFFTLNDAAKILGMHKRTVQRRLRRMNLECRVGRPRLSRDQIKKIAGVR